MMGLIDWFNALSRGDEKSAQTALSKAQSGIIKEDAVIEGLDFVAAIEAHRKWKERLTAYVEGTSSEKLDYTAICRDNQCALGKWIYSSGGTSMGDLSIYHQLKAKHAQFHITASRVVELVQNNDKDSAHTLLTGEEYSKTSIEVQMLISKLYGLMTKQ
ncbi:MAG: CZB domain-containing protein [Gallionella sp.]